MRGGAIASVERHVLRGRGIASWILVVVVGLSAGATMALVAGGRRAATSYDRLIEWADADDAGMGGWEGADCEEEFCSKQVDDFLKIAESMPQVESSERQVQVSQEIVGPDGQHYIGVGFEAFVIGLNKTGNTAGVNKRFKVLDGRVFSPSAANEALVSFDVAERFDLQVGDTLGIVVDSDTQLTDDVQITGIVAYPGSFPSFSGPADAVVFLTPAFADEHPELIDWTDSGLSLRFRGGPSDLDDFRAAVYDAGIPVGFVTSDREQAAGPRQLVRFDAGVLWFLAAVVGIGSLVVITQILRRAAIAATPEVSTLRTLGMRRVDLAAAAIRSGLRTGSAGALVAAAIAIAGSPLFPVGISRTAEPNPGISIDFVVLAIGVSATLLLTTLLTCSSTLLATRRSTPGRDRRFALASLANRLPPAPAAGVRLALTPASTGPGAMLRVGLLGLGSILAILVAAMSLTASLDNAIEDPTLTGGSWDGALSYFSDPQALNTANSALASDPRVESVALGGWSSFFYAVTVNGREVLTQILDTSTGIDIVTDRGRGPRGDSEIVLGEVELDALGVGIGDVVQVAINGGTSQSATVVGRAVLASVRLSAVLQGEGAAVTPALMARLGNDEAAFANIVRLRDRSDINRAIQELGEDYDSFFPFARPDRAGVESLRDVRSTINLVLAVLGVLTVAALLHRLVVTARSQRRQIAVLRAMGLTGGQVSSAGATTGLVVIALASLVAVPVGIVAGVVGWRAIADYLGVVPVSIVPAFVVIAAVAILVAAGVATGLAVVEQVRRRRPGTLLRTE